MKKVLIFILACLLLVCCHNQRRHNMVPVIQTDTMDVFRHIFKSRTLQDSLDAFIRETEKFTGYDTLVYSVSITVRPLYVESRLDTFVTFIMDDEIWYNYNMDNPENSIFLGAAIKGNKVIGVSCYGVSDYSDILYDNDYSQEVWYRHYMADLMRPYCDVNVFCPYSDRYQLVNNNLVLLRRHRYPRYIGHHNR